MPKVTIYALYSIASLILVYATATIFFNYHVRGSWLQFLGAYFLIMVTMFSIGMLVGGIAPNIKIAGVLATILYFPMLIFSGATLPYEVMPVTIQKVANILPLTQGIKLLKAVSLGLPIDSVLASVFVMITLAVICIGVSIRLFRWE